MQTATRKFIQRKQGIHADLEGEAKPESRSTSIEVQNKTKQLKESDLTISYDPNTTARLPSSGFQNQRVLKRIQSHFLKELMISAVLTEDLESIWTPQTPEAYRTPKI